jgi:sigma-B regulation protein RsbU (phosphoserine phosphatase)
MPAALFMIAVRTLSRHLAPTAGGAGDFLQRLNMSLTADNPTHLYVTLVYGIYDSKDGSINLACGGHPPPLLRRASGSVEVVNIRPSMLLGSAPVLPRVNEMRLTLGSGETLILYTDGYHEAVAPDGDTQFGVERLCEALGGERTSLPLEACAAAASAAVRRHTGQEELQDDQTLLLLRRK